MDQRLLEKLYETSSEILKQVTDQGKEIERLSTKMDIYSKRQDEFSQDLKTITQTANDALNSTKSAHNRLNKLEDELDEVPTKSDHKNISDRIGKLEKIVFWIATLIIGAVILRILNLI